MPNVRTRYEIISLHFDGNNPDLDILCSLGGDFHDDDVRCFTFTYGVQLAASLDDHFTFRMQKSPDSLLKLNADYILEPAEQEGATSRTSLIIVCH